MTLDIASTTDLNLTLSAGSGAPAPSVTGGNAPADFARALADAAPVAPPPGNARQALAATGNILPLLEGDAAAIVSGAGKDVDDAAADDAGPSPDAGDGDPGDLLAWWPAPLAPPEPAPPPSLTDGAGGAPVALAGDGGAAALMGADMGDDAPGAATLPDLSGDKPGPLLPRADDRALPARAPDPADAGSAGAAPVPNGLVASPPAGTVVPGALNALAGGAMPKGADAPGPGSPLAKDVKPLSKATLAVDDPKPLPVPAGQDGVARTAVTGDDRTAGPAGQVFAARIGAALDAPAPRSGKRTGAAIDPLSLLGTFQSGGASAMTARAVTGVAAADLPVIQASDPEWIEKFVDQIDMMRGADGARETRIRLSPDALGTLDVKIEQRDGQTHVQINADQAGARALLADAAPRLTDLAQARGLRLNTSFADGQGQSGQRQDQGTPTPRARRSSDAAVAADTPNDERIG